MANRIKALASLVPDNAVIADIGTDHAYLIVELFRTNKIKYAYAIDNKSGPIKNALDTINKNELNDVCSVIKADGLSFNMSSKINTLVFAGLGGFNIINIIKKNENKIAKIRYIVTDVHRDDDKVKDYFISLGYQIKKTLDIIDKKKTYHLVLYVKNK